MQGIVLRSCLYRWFLLLAHRSSKRSGIGFESSQCTQLNPSAFRRSPGWTDDDHAVAFDTFLKSCRAIVNGTRAMRSARPFYGALFKVCERAVAAGQLDRDHARKSFFENNFKPVRVTPAGQSRRLLYRLLRNRGGWLALPQRRIHDPDLHAAPAETVRRHQSKVICRSRSHQDRRRCVGRQGTGDLLHQESG